MVTKTYNIVVKYGHIVMDNLKSLTKSYIKLRIPLARAGKDCYVVVFVL